MTEQRTTIRYEDLGEPVKKLLRALKKDVSGEDMALLEWISVKDMAKIFSEMSTERQAAEIWEELKQSLESRREKARRKQIEIDQRQRTIDDQRQANEDQQRQQEEQERLERERAEEERLKRKAARRKQREEEAAAQLAAEEAQAIREQEEREEEERRLAEEEERRKQEARRRKREAKARQLAEEQEALVSEKQKLSSQKKTNQREEWKAYVAAHPLDFPDGAGQDIEQVKVERETKAPPKATDELLNRSYTPKCPQCGAKFSKAPLEWDCPMCLKRLRQKVKVWQPDDDTDSCLVCKSGIGRFSRHHCRSCGRLVCAKCSEGKAIIAQLGYKDPVKVCTDCLRLSAHSPS